MSPAGPSRERTIATVTELLRGTRGDWDRPDVSEDDFLVTCEAEELASLAYYQLRAVDSAAPWPTRVIDGLASIARANAAREVLIHREITDTLAAFADAGVSPIVLKGAAVAYTLYPTPSARPRTDTDIIVPLGQEDATRRVLEARGYRALNVSGGDLIFNQFAMTRMDRHGVHHAFDIHSKISTQSLFADVLDYDDFDAGATPIGALGERVRGAGPVHALLLACIHRVMHHSDFDWLIWSYDIHLLASALTKDQQERFVRLAIARGVAAVVASELAVARTRFATTGIDAMMNALSAAAIDEPSAAYLASGRRWHNDLASNIRGLPRWSDRARLLRQVMLPNGRYLLDAYGVANRRWSRAMLPALYVHRILNGTWKVATGRK